MTDRDMTSSEPAPRVAHGIRSWFDDQRHLDLIAVILMSITAVLTAWTGFESAKWSGVMSINFSEAAGKRSNALLVSDVQGTLISYQNALAIAWTDAEAAGDDELAATYRSLFPEGLETTVSEWESMPAATRPPSPLGLENYGDGIFSPVIDLQHEADDRFQAALTANQRSDNYVITTVMSASVLFFAALATKLTEKRLQLAMLAIALCGLVTTIAIIATFPIQV